MSLSREQRRRRADAALRVLLAALVLGLLAAVILRTAWVGDDAKISFRTVLNVTHGYGLRWNVGERVQAFTHPLWLLLVTAAYMLTGELVMTVLAISTTLSLGAASVVALGLSTSLYTGATAALFMVSSKAFVDYCTSGLENPLSYALVVAIVAAALRQRPGRTGDLVAVVGLGALLFVNRMDLCLLVAPLILVACARAGTLRRAAVGMLVGLTPAFAWMAFSLVYYGFPFPNTAYAKLATGYPRREFLIQGGFYFLESLDRDPLTLLTILAGVALGAWSRRAIDAALAAGVGVYLAYVLWIGGDFMSGRFFSVPFLAATILLARAPALPGPACAALAALAVGVGLTARAPNLLSDVDYAAKHAQRTFLPHLIVDERGYYFSEARVLSKNRELFPAPPWPPPEENPRRPRVRLGIAIGQMGLDLGPRVHIVDVVGLADPLLARLPGKYDKRWRIGHIERKLPPGYTESVRTGEARIRDKDLNTFYQHLKVVTQGDLFTWRRWRRIWAFNLGAYDHLVDRDKWGGPDWPPVQEPVASFRGIEARPIRENGDAWDSPGTVIFTGAIDLPLRRPLEGRRILDISVDNNDTYVLRYFRGDTQLAVQEIPMRVMAGGGLRRHRLFLPDAVQGPRFDRIRVQAIGGDGKYSVGHIRID